MGGKPTFVRRDLGPDLIAVSNVFGAIVTQGEIGRLANDRYFMKQMTMSIEADDFGAPDLSLRV
jgi:hypothetical protein